MTHTFRPAPSYLKPLAIVLTAVVTSAGSAVLLAEPQRPAVTAVAFVPDSGVRLSPERGALLADGLAMRIAESGRFRVLPREWMPAPIDGRQTTSIAGLREMARAAGVDYLIVGTVTRATTGRYVPRGPIQPRVLFSIGAGYRARLPVPPVARRASQCAGHSTSTSYLGVRVELVSVALGSVIRTSTARNSKPVPPGFTQSLLTGGCGQAAPPAVIDVSSLQLSHLDDAVAQVARTLSVPPARQ